jgi:hypothetical protein
MQIRARMSMSADGYVTTPDGWPSLTADPAFVSGESHGIREFLEGCEQALMCSRPLSSIKTKKEAGRHFVLLSPGLAPWPPRTARDWSPGIPLDAGCLPDLPAFCVKHEQVAGRGAGAPG